MDVLSKEEVLIEKSELEAAFRELGVLPSKVYGPDVSTSMIGITNCISQFWIADRGFSIDLYPDPPPLKHRDVLLSFSEFDYPKDFIMMNILTTAPSKDTRLAIAKMCIKWMEGTRDKSKIERIYNELL